MHDQIVENRVVKYVVGLGYAHLVCWPAIVSMCASHAHAAVVGSDIHGSHPAIPLKGWLVMDPVRSRCVACTVCTIGLLVGHCVWVRPILRCDGGMV